mmetsp:Transcript_886/g.2067  ORF Transcript_886/g.2067 Transcript_886/m.2067 type:complete len:234 (-) Transcript_886:308-1009(-)
MGSWRCLRAEQTRAKRGGPHCPRAPSNPSPGPSPGPSPDPSLDPTQGRRPTAVGAWARGVCKPRPRLDERRPGPPRQPWRSHVPRRRPSRPSPCRGAALRCPPGSRRAHRAPPPAAAWPRRTGRAGTVRGGLPGRAGHPRGAGDRLASGDRAVPPLCRGPAAAARAPHGRLSPGGLPQPGAAAGHGPPVLRGLRPHGGRADTELKPRRAGAGLAHPDATVMRGSARAPRLAPP